MFSAESLLFAVCIITFGPIFLMWVFTLCFTLYALISGGFHVVALATLPLALGGTGFYGAWKLLSEIRRRRSRFSLIGVTASLVGVTFALTVLINAFNYGLRLDTLLIFGAPVLTTIGLLTTAAFRFLWPPNVSLQRTH